MAKDIRGIHTDESAGFIKQVDPVTHLHLENLGIENARRALLHLVELHQGDTSLIQPLLDQLIVNEPTVPHKYTITVPEGRIQLESLVALAGGERRPLPLIEDILLPHPSDKTDFSLRIYHPSLTEKLPLMLYIHGGGWTRGNLHTHDKLCRRMAFENNIRIVSLDYRLSPENPFPAGLRDALAAYEWCLDHANELNIDKDRIVIAGDSGGGNIAAALTCTLKDQGKASPKMLMLFYPSLDLTGAAPSMDEFATGSFLTKEVVLQYTTNYIGPDHSIAKDNWQISPLAFQDFSGFPETAVLVCGADPIRDDGVFFEEKVRTHGNKTHFICMDGVLHAFLQLEGIFPQACQKAHNWVQSVLKNL